MVLVMAGCAHYPSNAPLKAYDPDKGYRFENIQNADNSDSLFVVLIFSGGGTRAAALSYGVLEQLKATMITREGKSRRLLDEVDVISGVSGGSFTAAYYALYGERIFAEYENVFLKQNIQGKLQRELYSPVNWVRLASPLYDRIDMAAEYYDENIFHHATFKDPLQKGRPYILINATDMTLGARFEFTQDHFDFLCSGLGDFPLSRAVAASSAFPGLLSPITIKNRTGGCDFRKPLWLSNALKDRDIGGRRFANATQMQSYLDPTRRPFIHLLDGGIADNIGLRGPYRSPRRTAQVPFCA
jgi:NTE family protein